MGEGTVFSLSVHTWGGSQVQVGGVPGPGQGGGVPGPGQGGGSQVQVQVGGVSGPGQGGGGTQSQIWGGFLVSGLGGIPGLSKGKNF